MGRTKSVGVTLLWIYTIQVVLPLYRRCQTLYLNFMLLYEGPQKITLRVSFLSIDYRVHGNCFGFGVTHKLFFNYPSDSWYMIKEDDSRGMLCHLYLILLVVDYLIILFSKINYSL